MQQIDATTATRAAAHGVNAGEARRALIAAGWTPLCHCGAAEHWVRGPFRCVIYVESSTEFASIDTDRHTLARSEHIYFARLACGTLITQ